MRYIFIDSKDGVDRAGIVEDNRLIEFHAEKQERQKLVGNIYRARVINVLSGMEAAFVDIGENKNAYLYVKDALSKDDLYNKNTISISEILKPGQEIIVQVIKEPSGNKGAKVTTHIEIPGRYLVLTAFSNKKNISKKILEKEEVKRLKSIGSNIIQDEMGMVFRTLAEGVDEDIIRDEYNLLHAIYTKIERQKNFLPYPKLLYKEPDLGYQLVRDTYNDITDKIIVNNKEKYNELVAMEEYYPFQFSEKIELNLKFSALYDSKIQSDLNNALKRIVNLKSGGYIVIDETEALTAIDINTGKFVGTRSLGDTVLKTNLEASEEIARQIRLRDIGGIIIIDFIDMRNEQDIDLVLSQLEKYLKRDRIKTNIIGITKLGLVELTRKKIRRSLSLDFYEKCPKCEGRGNIIDISY
jgi:ribonuclease G